MKVLGVDNMQEAMQIISSAGIEPEDIPALLASHGLDPSAAGPPGNPVEEIKLTRR